MECSIIGILFFLSIFLNSSLSHGTDDAQEAVKIAKKHETINLDKVEKQKIKVNLNILLNKIKALAPIIRIKRNATDKTKSPLGVITNVDPLTNSVIIQYINKNDSKVVNEKILLEKINLDEDPNALFSFIQNPTQELTNIVRHWRHKIKVPSYKGGIKEIITKYNDNNRNFHIAIEKLKADKTALQINSSARQINNFNSIKIMFNKTYDEFRKNLDTKTIEFFTKVKDEYKIGTPVFLPRSNNKPRTIGFIENINPQNGLVNVCFKDDSIYSETLEKMINFRELEFPKISRLTNDDIDDIINSMPSVIKSEYINTDISDSSVTPNLRFILLEKISQLPIIENNLKPLQTQLTELEEHVTNLGSIFKFHETNIKNALIKWKQIDSKLNSLTSGNISPPDVTKISQDQCQAMTFNNIANFGPDTDQGSTPICWAHAAAHLFREQAHMVNPLKPGENVSVAEIASMKFKLAAPDGAALGSVIDAYLEKQFDQKDARSGKIFSKGIPPAVCLDKYGKNPYDEVGDSIFATLQNFYDNYKANACNKDTVNLNEKVFDPLLKDRLLWSMSLDSSVQLTSDKLKELARNAKTANIFKEQVLTYYCNNIPLARKPLVKEGEYLVQNSKTYLNIRRKIENGTYTYKDQDLTNHVKDFISAKSANHSLGLSICYYPLVDEIKRRGGTGVSAQEFNARNTKCGGHAVVAAAVRWDDQKGCEVYVKNSHGPRALLKSDWYPAELIFSHTFNLINLKTKKK